PGLADRLIGELALRRHGAPRSLAPRPLRRFLVRCGAAARLVAARTASLALVRAGRLGARAYLAHWRECFRYGFVEAWTTVRESSCAGAPPASEPNEAMHDAAAPAMPPVEAPRRDAWRNERAS